MVAGYGVLELLIGLSAANDGVAHFAHLGGMIFGFFMIWCWEEEGGWFMATSIDPARRHRSLRALGAIAAVNVGVFIVLRLCAAFAPSLLADLVGYLAFSASDLLDRPWTPVSYMFTRYDELHLILNMLWLAWFWLLMADAGLRARTLTAIYFAGGLAAAAAYAMIAPDGLLLGSSGAVMGVVAAAAVVTPRRRIDLPLMKPVSVALAAGIIIAINLLCMMLDATWSNIAHLAGIAAGAAVASLAGARFGKSYNDRGKPSDGHANDALIDKLRTSGFSSLSPSERSAIINDSRKQQ